MALARPVLFMGPDQQAVLSVRFLNNGNLTSPDSAPVWVCQDADHLTLSPFPGGMTCLAKAIGTPGHCRIQVLASFMGIPVSKTVCVAIGIGVSAPDGPQICFGPVTKNPVAPTTTTTTVAPTTTTTTEAPTTTTTTTAPP